MGKLVDVLKAILTRIIFAGHGFVGMSIWLTFFASSATLFLRVFEKKILTSEKLSVILAHWRPARKNTNSLMLEFKVFVFKCSNQLCMIEQPFGG